MDGSIIQSKTVFVSNGGKCFEYKVNSDNITGDERTGLSSRSTRGGRYTHCLPCKSYYSGNVLVRSTETDILVILLGLVGRSKLK